MIKNQLIKAMLLCFSTALSVHSFAVQADMQDRVLVIVNEDVITQSEFDYRLQSVEAEIRRSGESKMPPNMHKQLLAGMVSDLLQLQEAKRRGLDISDAELEQAIGRYAQLQKLTVDQLYDTLRSRGENISKFKQTIRDSLLISRLSEYYARARVVVPDYEIDGFIQQNKLGNDNIEYNVAHLLIKAPQTNQELAERVRKEIVNGMSFSQAVEQYSQAGDEQEGGVIGWRSAEQLPELFLDALKQMQVGGITPVLRSQNGLHILKLLDLKGERTEIEQRKVRHILFSAKTKIAKLMAARRLQKIRERILNGESFSSLARIYSDDSVSAANGGSLDWVSPGQMVPSFEQVYQSIEPNQVSDPFESHYGVHILQVTDTRKKNITEEITRVRAENILRRRRAEREFKQWIRELQEQAYIQYVAEPAQNSK